MLHLYTGDGKGKTTAAVGLAVRARGHGRRVLFVQFLKGGPTGELKELEQLGVEVLRIPVDHGFWWTLDEAEKARVQAEHTDLVNEVLRRLQSDEPPDLLVLDEFTYVYTTPMADVARCRVLLDQLANPRLESVLTGRNPGPLADLADYLTEMKALKHPFSQGTPAREGVEY